MPADPGRQDSRKTSDPYAAQKVRQGEIILRRPWQRMTFLAGLAGCVLLVILVYLFR